MRRTNFYTEPSAAVWENLFSLGWDFRWHIFDTTLYPAYAKPAHRTEQKAIFSTNLLSSLAIVNTNKWNLLSQFRK